MAGQSGCESVISMKRRSWCSVKITYKDHDPALDSALRAFAKLYNAGKNGSGFNLQTNERDISFSFCNPGLAQAFLEHVKDRFRVKTKLILGRN